MAALASGWGKETALRVAALRRRALRKIATFLQAKKKEGRLLDCGCSSGALFESFDPSRWERHGVELSPTAATHAAEATGATVHTGTLRTAQYPCEWFDLVTIIDTFYYFDDPLQQLQEVARILRRDGVLGIEIPGGRYSRIRSRGLLCLLSSRKWYRLASDSSFLFIYSAAGFLRLAKKAGFDLLECQVIPSPQTSRCANAFSSIHYLAVNRTLRRWPQVIDWCPKVLWIFRKK